jgi:hypothetical protein
VDEFAQTLITSWPSATTGVDLGFDDCLCHYFGGLIPSKVGKVGLGIPDGWPGRRRGRAPAADLRWVRAAAGDG